MKIQKSELKLKRNCFETLTVLSKGQLMSPYVRWISRLQIEVLQSILNV